MPDRLELSLLLDYYGGFLTENQRELIELSCDEDYTLSEIAEQKGISRQGVRDAIARGSRVLSEMENKLRLIERDRRAAELIRRLKAELDALSAREGEGFAEKLTGIYSTISELSDLTEGKDGI